MASEMETDRENQHLKHLGFVRMAAIHTLMCASNLYDYAKENSGTLRSTVGSVEGAVTTVVGPVYEKLKGVPDDLLVFLDKKVDEASHKFDEHAPPFAKQVVSKAHSLIQKASQKAQKLVNVVQHGGPRAAVHYVATEYKQFILSQSVKMWVALNRCPPFHTVADKAVPAAGQLTDKYNNVVKDMTQKGYPLFGYLPLVPVEDISKAFEQGDADKGDATVPSEHKSDSSDSD
ncbi:REF/SRPP-like protein At1g67360 [Juglans microcarpa x Juglans regia]|uniref:REF/SRPP-like protein At1g67360 n=1 Tax=Juglans microcarpa x Juglans regia TaxID=2249226 RepID=UPI001B7E162F|nr:REF/SRPP-like protein At1g67360 [Juglans microcarpa x Juglans regia]